MGVNLGRLQKYFDFYDFKGGCKDGKLSRSEIAHAAQDLILNSGNCKEKQQMGLLFATIAQGGRDGEGAFSAIDRNGNEGLSMGELQRLAQLGGDSDTIDCKDFQAVLGDRYQPGGRGADLRRLQMMAMDNITGSPNYNPVTPAQAMMDRQQAQDPIGALEAIRANLDPASPEAQQIDRRIAAHQLGALETIRTNLDPRSPEAQQVNCRIAKLRDYLDPQGGAQQQQNQMMTMLMMCMASLLQMFQTMRGGNDCYR